MKKIIFSCLACIICVSLCACGEKETVNNEQESNNESQVVNLEPQADESGFATMIHNGNEISLGDYFEDVKSLLGDETKPSETVTACGPGQTSDIHLYYFDNFVVHVDSNGKIVQFQTENSNISVKAGAHVGQDFNEAKATSNVEPEFEFEGYVSYKFSDCMASIEYDENGLVNKISVESYSEE